MWERRIHHLGDSTILAQTTKKSSTKKVGKVPTKLHQIDSMSWTEEVCAKPFARKVLLKTEEYRDCTR